jgi:hypothetical protein
MDSDDEPLFGPVADMRRLQKQEEELQKHEEEDNKPLVGASKDYLKAELAGMSQQESQDLDAEAVDEAEARLGKEASNSNTPCKDSDYEPMFEPVPKMRRLLEAQEDVVRQSAQKMKNRFKGKSALKITT